MKTYIRKIGLGILLTIFLFSVGCGSESDIRMVEKESTGITIGDISDRNNTDVVLVLDESGSMPKADPNRFAIEGAKLFIDMEKVAGINVGLIEFSNNIKSTGLVKMEQKQNKQFFKDILESIRYSGTAHTDTGAAMLEAVSVLEQSDSANDKAIILFTDGKTAINKGTPGRTTQDSLNEVDTAVQMAAEKGYTIYCIGLNYNGSVDENELAKMTAATQGKYHIATNVEELREFYNSIFAEIDDTKEEKIDEYVSDGEYHESKFSIEGANVSETNIVILSSRQVEDVILTNPNGEVIDLEGDEKVIFSTSETYSLVKLISPMLGEWKISVKGINGDQIKIAMIYNFNINLMIEAEQTSIVKGESIDVKAYLASDGEIIKDTEFYNNMSGYITIVNCENGQVDQEELFVGGAGDCLTGYFYPDATGEYEVNVHVEGNRLFRDSDSFKITVTKYPVSVVKDFEKVKVKVKETKEINLNEYFNDADNDAIGYSIKNAGSIVGTEVNDAVLKITGIQSGKDVITICADNGAAEVREVTISIKCVTVLEMILGGIVWIIAAAVIAGIVFLILESGKKLEGVFKVNLVFSAMDEYGTNAIQKYDILNDIQLSTLGKRTVSISNLLRIIHGYYTSIEFDQSKKEAFGQLINRIIIEAKKVKISGSKKPFEIKIQKNSDKVLFYNLGTVSDKKAMSVSLGNNMYQVGGFGDCEFGIRFVHNENSYTQLNIKYRKI